VDEVGNGVDEVERKKRSLSFREKGGGKKGKTEPHVAGWVLLEDARRGESLKTQKDSKKKGSRYSGDAGERYGKRAETFRLESWGIVPAGGGMSRGREGGKNSIS